MTAGAAPGRESKLTVSPAGDLDFGPLCVGESSEQVQLFNHAKATCAQVLSKSGREVPEGEIDVRANAGDTTTVGVGASTQFGVAVKMISAAPTKPGDIVTLCVPETKVTGFGDLKDKAIVVSGTFTGAYCGVRQF